MNRYRSIQFALDGGYIFDYSEATPDLVWSRVNDQGSKWIYYPIPFVVTDNPGQNFKYAKIIDTPDYPELFKYFKGKTIRTAREFIIKHSEMIGSIL